MYSAISGDIIAFTSLSNEGKGVVETKIIALLALLQKEYSFFGRMIKGDYLEGICEQPENALRVALIIKSFIKSLSDSETIQSKNNRRFKLFKEYGVRLAVGLGKMDRVDFKKGVMDGEAIYYSGRIVNQYNTHEKEKSSVKHSLFFKSGSASLNQEMTAIFYLLDFIIQKATAKQCKVLYYKLRDYKEEEIALQLKISQPVVNQQSKSVGWNVIENAVLHFHSKIASL